MPPAHDFTQAFRMATAAPRHAARTLGIAANLKGEGLTTLAPPGSIIEGHGSGGGLFDKQLVLLVGVVLLVGETCPPFHGAQPDPFGTSVQLLLLFHQIFNPNGSAKLIGFPST